MDLSGVHVPLLTPMHADGSVDLDGLAGLVERLLAAGVDGFVALGTTGEFADLTWDERADVAATVVRAASGRAPVLVGVGGLGTTEACAHARAAAEAGADAVLCLPPLYWKLPAGGITRHFARVAAATDLPLLLYDFPALSGTPLSPALVEQVVREVPSVVGMKLSGPELRGVHGVIRAARTHRPDFAVLVGAAELLLPALLGGADGGILAVANIAPEAALGVVAAVRRGDLAQARAHERDLLEALTVSGIASPPVLALKVAAGLAPNVRTAPDDAERVQAEASRWRARI